jgi:aldehyde:ferredoxin oxidoreductase
MDAGVLEFGDGPAAIEMVTSVAKGTRMGRRIGHGPDAVGRHLNHPRVPTVKGQSIAGYDPRAMPGMGVTYATSPMGGDHTAGFVGGVTGSIDTLRNASKSSQVHMAAFDSMGVCMFAQSGRMENLFEAVAALTGKPFGSREWQQLGTQILTAEIDFNRRAGLTEKDDRLPEMFHKEQLTPHFGTVPYPESDLRGTFAPIRQTLEMHE